MLLILLVSSLAATQHLLAVAHFYLPAGNDTDDYEDVDSPLIQDGPCMGVVDIFAALLPTVLPRA